LAAAVESLFASINPSIGDTTATEKAISQALATVAAAQFQSSVVRRSTFNALRQLFDRLQEHMQANAVNPNAESHIKTLLFGPDPGTEALRLLRADAIVSLAKTSPTLGSALRPNIVALISEERAAPVLERLRSAT
jgi:proteasome component ECM29